MWDETDYVNEINREVYATVESDPENPRSVQIPAAMLLHAVLSDGDVSLS